MSRFALILALALPLSAAARPPAPDDQGARKFAEVLGRMKSVSDGLTEYTMRLYKREYVDGDMTPQEVIDVAWRRPWDVVMRWVGDRHQGRVLLYRGREWNGGKFVVDPGPMMPVVSLDPESRLAMAGGRHSLYDLPIGEVIDKFVRDATKIEKHPTWAPDVVDEGPTTVRGEKTHCYLMRTPKNEDPTLYARQIRACVGSHGLPNAFRAWDEVDGELVLIEEYDYIGTDTSPGFSEAHFDRDALGL